MVLKDGTEPTMDVKIGENIMFGKHSGQTVQVHGEEPLVLREEESLAALEH